jgi:hypothetical protein
MTTAIDLFHAAVEPPDDSASLDDRSRVAPVTSKASNGGTCCTSRWEHRLE